MTCTIIFRSLVLRLFTPAIALLSVPIFGAHAQFRIDVDASFDLPGCEPSAAMYPSDSGFWIGGRVRHFGSTGSIFGVAHFSEKHGWSGLDLPEELATDNGLVSHDMVPFPEEGAFYFHPNNGWTYNDPSGIFLTRNGCTTNLGPSIVGGSVATLTHAENRVVLFGRDMQLPYSPVRYNTLRLDTNGWSTLEGYPPLEGSVHAAIDVGEAGFLLWGTKLGIDSNAIDGKAIALYTPSGLQLIEADVIAATRIGHEIIGARLNDSVIELAWYSTTVTTPVPPLSSDSGRLQVQRIYADRRGNIVVKAYRPATKRFELFQLKDEDWVHLTRRANATSLNGFSFLPDGTPVLCGAVIQDDEPAPWRYVNGLMRFDGSRWVAFRDTVHPHIGLKAFQELAGPEFVSDTIWVGGFGVTPGSWLESAPLLGYHSGSWHRPPGSINGHVRFLESNGSALLVGGTIVDQQGDTIWNAAILERGEWQAIGNGVNYAVATGAMSGDKVIVGRANGYDYTYWSRLDGASVRDSLPGATKITDFLIGDTTIYAVAMTDRLTFAIYRGLESTPVRIAEGSFNNSNRWLEPRLVLRNQSLWIIGGFTTFHGRPAPGIAPVDGESTETILGDYVIGCAEPAEGGLVLGLVVDTATRAAHTSFPCGLGFLSDSSNTIQPIARESRASAATLLAVSGRRIAIAGEHLRTINNHAAVRFATGLLVPDSAVTLPVIPDTIRLGAVPVRTTYITDVWLTLTEEDTGHSSAVFRIPSSVPKPFRGNQSVHRVFSPGRPVSFPVTYHPSTTYTHELQVRAEFDSGGTYVERSFVIQGIGVDTSRRIHVSSSHLDFEAGSTSFPVERPLTINNPLPANGITTIRIDMPDNPAFSLSTVGTNFSLPINESRLIVLRYKQQGNSSDRDTLRIHHDATGIPSPILISLDGRCSGISDVPDEPKRTTPRELPELSGQFLDGQIIVDLARRNNVSIALFNVSGRISGEIFNGQMGEGRHAVPVDFGHLPGGRYYAMVVVEGIPALALPINHVE